ncbi:MAG: hypothetical protein RMY64_34815 [Nostoc sp. DedQUE08]|uniref:hypothetical protein n=1 Tax=Nostoc sp. DedQUE08 TaxID=3075393 RepID=UPI002AD5531B|nr:hypothetical protein [Nostoc sp. DedQUE08]MDZ8070727.1 hypothetical protein [Nostoc sp. DedQUE08]
MVKPLVRAASPTGEEKASLFSHQPRCVSVARRRRSPFTIGVLIVFTSMNFPPQLQQKIEKWANSQGISTEQFVLQAIAEKIDTLSQQITEEHTQQNSEMADILPLNQSNIYRKEGILVVEAELPENFDVNAFIDELREERIQDQIT